VFVFFAVPHVLNSSLPLAKSSATGAPGSAIYHLFTRERQLQVEHAMCKKFNSLPLVVKQAKTKAKAMSASTLQVQLCEYSALVDG